jgi:hypothetical protein
VGHCSAEISNSLKSNKANGSWPEEFETALFQNGCLEFRSLAKVDLRLKLKGSVISASLQSRPDASSTSLLPIGMQTPVVSTETRGRSCTWLWRTPLLIATAV